MLRKSFFFVLCAVAGNIYGMHEPLLVRAHLALTHTRPADPTFSKIQQVFVPLHTDYYVTVLSNGDSLRMFVGTEHDGSYRVACARRTMPVDGGDSLFCEGRNPRTLS